jgi:hypothetical protein
MDKYDTFLSKDIFEIFVSGRNKFFENLADGRDAPNGKTHSSHSIERLNLSPQLLFS